MIPTDEMVEAGAAALFEDGSVYKWEQAPAASKDVMRRWTRAALTAALASVPEPSADVEIGAVARAIYETRTGFNWDGEFCTPMDKWRCRKEARAAIAAMPDRDAAVMAVRKEINDIRFRQVQALHAGISRKDWRATEEAAIQLRDRIDAALRSRPALAAADKGE